MTGSASEEVGGTAPEGRAGGRGAEAIRRRGSQVPGGTAQGSD